MTLRARAVLLGDRLNPDRTSEARLISTAPFSYRKGEGYVVAFRYGAAVLIGLSPEDEEESLARLAPPGGPQTGREEERLALELQPGAEEGLSPAGVLQLKGMNPAQALVLADILGKSVALAHYEKEVASVFDTIEPAASRLAASGELPSRRHELLKLVGSALLTQHRVSGRIAFAEKPDILWEHPELERFYARLEDEYEIVERGTLLNQKMSVIASAAETFTDMMDTARSARLELLIVILILAELVIAAATLFHPW
jgi:required for meiotic nuclear division protein 1